MESQDFALFAFVMVDSRAYWYTDGNELPW